MEFKRMKNVINYILGNKVVTVNTNGKEYKAKEIKLVLDGKEVDTFTNNIVINITGDCEEVSSTNGDVNVVGDVKTLSTTNGDIEIDGAVGSVTTTNGDVKASMITGKVSTVNGNIKV